jgi:hypothetical protein
MIEEEAIADIIILQDRWSDPSDEAINSSTFAEGVSDILKEYKLI